MRIRLWTAIVLVTAGTQLFGQQPPGAAIKLSDVSLDQDQLRVHFIDVGPGLAMLVETPGDRKHMVIDGGKWGLSDFSTYVKKFVGDNDVDIAVVTHADLDHFLGMRKIFQDYTVNQFWNTGYTSPVLSGQINWNAFLNEVSSEMGCEIYSPMIEWVAVGDREVIDDGGTPNDAEDDVIVQYLNIDADPPAKDAVFGREFTESERRNNASLVFKLIYKDVSFLITGDINGRDKDHVGAEHDNEIDSEELELWTRHQLDPAKYGLKATVLQVSHHGSNGSSSLRFLKAVEPKWAVIPAGHQFSHPKPDTLRRLGVAGVADNHVLRTDEGDSTPEVPNQKDPRGDDSFVFETNGTTITKITRVKTD